MNPRNRVITVTVLLAAAFTGISTRLVWIQMVKQDEYQEQAIRLHTRGEAVPAQRGSILDVSGRVLAQSMPLIEVRLDGKILAERPQELPVLAEILGVSAEWLKGQADPENRYQKIAEGVGAEVEGKLRASRLGSIRLERKTVRNYPNGTETAQILGYVNLREQTAAEGDRPAVFEVGEAGVEKSMDRYLRGVAGERRIIKDNKGREIPYFRLSDRPARDGYHVVLTLDQTIQHIVEREADALMEQFHPEDVHIVVMRPATGEILAMASRPTFDPNQRQTFEGEALKNRPIADTYEPGSTFKVVTLAAGLNEGAADLGSTYFCEDGQMFYAGHWLKDHEPYGLLTLRQVVAKSSNIGMAKLAMQVGEEKIFHYARLFGFGERAQKGEGALPGEEKGLLRGLKNWNKISITRIPMGYEVAVTNLQMALAYGAIANGGKRMEPRLVKAVVDRDNRVVMQFIPKVVCQVIRSDTANKVIDALRGVVSDSGTAENAAVPGFEVAGKTGTAQKWSNGVYSKEKYRSSFIGFLPADHPEFLVSIMVDEPKGKLYYGGQVAAPAFKNIAIHVAEQLNLNRGAVVATREKNVKLTEVMDGVKVQDWQGERQAEVSALAYESNRVKPGSLFCTWKGQVRDGHAFVPDAVKHGAVAVVAERALGDLKIPGIRVENGRRALGQMAANFYGNPSRQVRVVGITGTNGKTSTAMLLQSLLEEGGLRSGLLGTVVNDTGKGRVGAKHTTPEALDLQQYLAEMRENGCRAAAIEVSSHALDQGRTEGVEFAGAIFTNLGRDHLDYHQTMEAYEAAKAQLFRGLGAGSFAVVNAEDPVGIRMASLCRPGVRILRYGLELGEVHARNVKMGIGGSSFVLCAPEGEVAVTLPWLGNFNVANALAAAAGALATGVPLKQVAAGLGRAPAVPGRLERVAGPQEITVLIDYAHTEDAVRAVLETLRPLTQGKLWIVLGAGGDRDKGKRPKMAAAAEHGAHEVILTSDNPRREDPYSILREMQSGLSAHARVRVIENRSEAIRAAILGASKGDVVLIAGKGHEEFQEIQGTRLPFSDRREAERAWAERGQV